MDLGDLPRLFRTVRHLRWSQIQARLRRTLPSLSRLLEAPPDLPERIDDARAEQLSVLPPLEHSGAKGRECLELLERGIFRHLNASVEVGREHPDWQLGPRTSNRLWVITLHYHQWLYELATLIRHAAADDRQRAEECFRHYLADWLKQCDLSRREAAPLANCPYAVATRLGWWGRAYYQVSEEFRRRETELMRRWAVAAWQQAEFLASHLEWDLRANHLLRDAVGLAWAARVFGAAAPPRWAAIADRIAREQAREQVLPDGGHFERSPMYHLEVMGDFLSLALLLPEASSRAEMAETCQRMADFALWLSHPDGSTAQFNDGSRRLVREALQEGSKRNEIVARAPPRGFQHFRDFGLCVWQGDPWTIFFDVGAVGPDYQPGHAHADSLALECSFRGRRLLVDPGCYGYDLDDRRRYDRSTAAHNTVCIDGVDSSEVWHIFRVGRRARPVSVSAEGDQVSFRVQGSHTGYDHLPGRPRHVRVVNLSSDNCLEVRDSVLGGGRHRVVAGWLLEPDWSVSERPSGWELTADHLRLRVHVRGPEPLQLALTRQPLHPDYGVESTTCRLECHWTGELPLELVTRIEEA